MLPFGLLVLVTIVATFAVFTPVNAAPSSSYFVELMTCESKLNSTATQCLSVCEPVLNAQSICNGRPHCTCTTAPADTIQACLQCHIDESTNEYFGDTLFEIPLRLQTYTMMCDNVLETRSQQTLPDIRLPEPPANQTLTRREGGVCVYGLPDVTMLSQSQLPNYRSPWFLLVFVFVALFYILRIRTKTPA